MCTIYGKFNVNTLQTFSCLPSDNGFPKGTGIATRANMHPFNEFLFETSEVDITFKMLGLCLNNMIPYNYFYNFFTICQSF